MRNAIKFDLFLLFIKSILILGVSCVSLPLNFTSNVFETARLARSPDFMESSMSPICYDVDKILAVECTKNNRNQRIR